MSRTHADRAAPPSNTPAAARTFRLRTVLVALVVVALAPAIGTATGAIWHSVHTERQASATRLADTVRTLAYTIENELSAKSALLQTMAAGIGSGGIGLAQAQSWLDGQHTDQGHLVLSEPGRTTQVLPDAFVQDALARGGVSLSNLLGADGSTAPIVALSVPLPARNGRQALLSLVLPAKQLMSLAPERPGADDSLLVAVTDGTGRLIARSRDGLRRTGHAVPDWDRLQALGTPRGQFEAVTAEGHDAVMSFETLAATPGWVVVVGVPKAAIDQAWQRPLIQLATGSAIGMLGALLVAIWLARTIARPARDLARNARSVHAATDGAITQPALARPSRITEFETLRHSLEDAHTALRARAEAERRNAQALALNELRYRTLARTGAVVLWRASPDGLLHSADGWGLLTGEPDAAALGFGWRQRLHPDDHHAMHVTPGEQQVDMEFRIARQDGSWCWVRGRGTAVPAEDGVVREWVGVLEDVSERHAAQARIAHMALHDALTGLPNRVEFRNRLEAAIRRARRGDTSSVLYIDLDRFKRVNDTLGHPVGDALLLAVTGRLRMLLRQDDSVARLAGDEFAIIQSRLSSPRDAAELATRVVQTLSEPYDITGHRVGIGASVGIMLVTDDSCDADRLLKYADMALYRAKQEGRGRHSFFEPEMDVRMQDRRRSEHELREAMDHERFELRYAPLVNAQRRTLSGVSTALHWNHPRRGPLPDTEFQVLADELGLSGRLLEWTLTRVCADLSTWPDCPKAALDVSAALRWGAPALCAWVDAALAATHLAPQRLELEISVAAAVAAPDTAARIVQCLQQRGVRVALSQVGSGRSALGQLRDLPFNKIKIARAMLACGDAPRQRSAASVRAVAMLCEELGMLMAAEGVETDAHLADLPHRAHVELQGALFGGHCAAAEIPAVCQALASAG